MTHSLRNRLMAGALAVAVVLALPAAAFAAPGAASAAATSTTTSSSSGDATGTAPASNPFCTPATFTVAQQTVEAALSGRVTQLKNLITDVTDSPHLTATDSQTLGNDLNNVELPGIEALQPEAQSATTCFELRPVARQMVLTYRVYVVMTPQTHITIALDDEAHVEGVFENLEPTITAAITAAKAQGRDVTAAQGALDDLEAQVTGAQSETNGLSATVLAQTPSGAPGNWQVFLSARTSATNARNDLQAAYNDLRQIVQDLG